LAQIIVCPGRIPTVQAERQIHLEEKWPQQIAVSLTGSWFQRGLLAIFRDSIELEKAKIEAKTELGHPPYCILGLRSAVKRTIKHILNLLYLKIAFLNLVGYDSFAGKVFLHFVQSIFSKIFTLPAPKKIFSSQKKS
jgi:hypothetical protein